jgi:predicted nuclease of predicted toxin-antitoxin system
VTVLAFKIDENLPVELAELLRAHGHDAMTVRDQKLGGRVDPEIAHVCKSEGRALITLDLDFANVRAYPPHEHPGIIVLRVQRQDRATVLSVASGMLPLLEREPLSGKLWIVEPDRVRIWRHGSEE